MRLVHLRRRWLYRQVLAAVRYDDRNKYEHRTKQHAAWKHIRLSMRRGWELSGGVQRFDKSLLIYCRCPGRYFAEAEVALVVALLLSSFDTFQLEAVSAIGKNVPLCSGSNVDGPIVHCKGHSGDPHQLLPGCKIEQLVGLKVPLAECWVQTQRHSVNMR